MTDKKTIGISTLITLLIITTAAVTPSFFEEQKYYCEAESSIINCPGGLSGGTATRCYLNTEQNSWDYCKSGWLNVTDDRPIQEEPEPDQPIINNNFGKQYSCNNINCTEIN